MHNLKYIPIQLEDTGFVSSSSNTKPGGFLRGKRFISHLNSNRNTARHSNTPRDFLRDNALTENSVLKGERYITWLSCFTSILLLVVFLTACDKHDQLGATENQNTIRVGVILGTEQKFMQAVKNIAAEKYDLNVELIPYTHFAELNKALSDKEIDANVSQNEGYLQYSEKKYGYHFAELGHTYIFPMEIYSKKVKSILQLPKGALIVISDEPVEGARALHLLDDIGLLRMKSDEDITAGIADIASNPSNFKILPLPAEKIASMVPMADIVVLNIDYALGSGLIPSKNVLAIENSISDHANVVVVRENEKNDPRLKALIQIFQSPEVEQEANRVFRGQAIPAWK